MLTAHKEQRHYIINLNELGRMHLQMGDTQQAFERVEAAQAKALSWATEGKSSDISTYA